MSEKELNNVSSEQEVVNNADTNYLDTIKNLKENSVSKEEYDKLLKENKTLLDNYINSTPVEDKVEEVVDVKDLAKQLGNPNLNNLEYVTIALKLRDACIKQKHYDPFVGDSKINPPTEEDIKSARRVAQVYRECIDYAQGDNQAFTNELQRRIIDVQIPKKKSKF